MLNLHVGIRVNRPSYTWNALSATKRIMQCAAPTFWEIPLTDVLVSTRSRWGVAFGVKKT